MKINSIEVTEVLGIKSVTLPMPRPVTIIGGRNGAGKSSIAESIRMVFGASPERVKLKGDYKSLVHDGSKKGIAAVLLDGQDDAFTVTLPKGDTTGDFSDNLALPYCLDTGLFARASDDDRRKLLFSMSGQKVSGASVKEKLIERGHDEKLVDAVLPFLRGGFPAAASKADDMLKEARGAWRGVTGEAYGTTKAETWAPELQAERPTGEQLADARANVEQAQSELDKARQDVATLQAQAKAYADWKAKVPQDAEKQIATLTAKVERLGGDLKTRRAELEQAQAKAGAAERKGLVHDLARGLSFYLSASIPEGMSSENETAAADAMLAYERQYGVIGASGDPEARAKLPELSEAISLLESTLENAQRDIAKLESVKDMASPEVITDDEVQAAQQVAQAAQSAVSLAGKAFDAIQAAEREHAAADKRETDAKQHHADALKWQAIREALEPAGIPSEFLAAALDPFNERLKLSANDSGWRVASVDADMQITYGGRRYSLCSESEKYRADLMLSEAVSNLSRNRILLADAFDVLEPTARVEFFQWLDTLALNEEVDSVIALGTMQAEPMAPGETFNTFFLGDKS